MRASSLKVLPLYFEILIVHLQTWIDIVSWPLTSSSGQLADSFEYRLRNYSSIEVKPVLDLNCMMYGIIQFQSKPGLAPVYISWNPLHVSFVVVKVITWWPFVLNDHYVHLSETFCWLFIRSLYQFMSTCQIIILTYYVDLSNHYILKSLSPIYFVMIWLPDFWCNAMNSS